MERLAVSGASGKSGWRVVDEALQRGLTVRAIVRPKSVLPPALVIATGARPSINLAGPLQVDAAGVQAQIQACRAVGLQRVVLVSSLCAGRWLHPLNLFG